MRNRPFIGYVYPSFGYRIDRNYSTPTLTAIGNVAYHAIQPIYAKMRAAVIKDDETVNYYLKSTDLTKKEDNSASDLTGTDGQVMIYKPAYYKRVVTDTNYHYVMFSFFPMQGYEYKPAYWIGQQLGNIDANGKLRSVHGVMATTNKNLPEFRAAARLRGSNNWCAMPYEVWEALNDIFRLKYLTLHSQATTALGAGATNANSTDWSNYNGRNTVVACGLKLSVDDTQVAFSVANFVGGTGTLNSNAACLAGIEHVFGHIFQWVDGLNINYTAEGALAYICKNPAQFVSDTTTNYTLAGNVATGSSNYIRSMIDGGVLPSAVGGTGTGSTGYYCDYHTISSSLVWRAALVVGSLAYGSAAGLACSLFSYGASDRSANFGSRLCLYVG